jgi:predicted O-methyltransferase YrrM
MHSAKFDEVTEKLRGVPYMTADRAAVIRDLIHEAGAENVLELGFFKGKSACYMAAVLEDQGRGHVTTIDLTWARSHKPGINEHLAITGLKHRVTPVFARRSYTWELAKMLKQEPRPVFDFCYLDGGHTWDATGYGFVLVDMLLRPGGIIVLDDLNWTINKHLENHPDSTKHWERYDDDEKDEQGVRLVWNTVVRHLGYQREALREFPWGIARKPVEDSP